MKIIDAELDFISTPERRDVDFTSLLNTKILLLSENSSTIDINSLHTYYKKINFVGIPYHYIVKKNGDIFLLRSRVYKADQKLSYSNVFKNAICILIEGLESEQYSAGQAISLPQLVSMIIMQDHRLVSDVVSFRQIFYGTETASFKSMITTVSADILTKDIYRRLGDGDTLLTFDKVVAGGVVDSVDTIAKYTNVPRSVIVNMNKHILDPDAIIPPGTTVFLPDNRSHGYCKNIYETSKVNSVLEKVKKEVVSFRIGLQDSGKEVI